jgi:hypothetical protein
VGQHAGNGEIAVNIHTRLNAVERERSRRCAACGGTIDARPARLTLDEVIAACKQLTDLEKVELYRRAGREDLIPPRLLELAQRQGVMP